MINKQLTFILFIINLFIYSALFGQEDKKKVYYQDVDMEYFIVEPFTSDFQNELEFDPSELIKEKYSKCQMFCLNGLKKYAWPDEAINNPQLILYIEAALLEEGESSGVPEVSVKEKDFNGNRLSFIGFPPSIKCKSNKAKCATSAIKRFNEKFEKQQFLLGYTKRRTIYPKSGPLYVNRDTVSVIKTGLDRSSVELLLEDKDASNIEGIYNSIDKTGAIYTLGIIRSDSIHKIVVLESNIPEWEEGDLKGTLEIDRETNDYRVQWTTANNSYVSPKAVFRNNGQLELRFDEPMMRRTKYFKKIR